jgi:acetoin utilization deacetylase AcuC-like enzyme
MMRQSPMVILHSPRCLDYAAPGHPENPERVRSAVALLQKESHTWVVPTPCADEDILRVHTREMLEAVRTGAFDDADTPFFPDIFEIAKLSAGGAILAAEYALAGRPAFSLMRPPGHHAERNRVMGFCYFNNIAIAVAKVLASQNPVGRGGPPRRPVVESRTARRAVPTNDPANKASHTTNVKRVAILDFDCHHGNGTEDIFRGDERVLFVSMHQSPCYPGTGLASAGNCVNYPLPPGTGPEKFLETLDEAIVHIRDFNPDLLAISAGFDAYKNDPITQMGLEIETFHEIGRRVADFAQPASPATAVPCFAVLEGGYAREFAQCVEAFIGGWERH